MKVVGVKISSPEPITTKDYMKTSNKNTNKYNSKKNRWPRKIPVKLTVTTVILLGLFVLTIQKAIKISQFFSWDTDKLVSSNQSHYSTYLSAFNIHIFLSLIKELNSIAEM